MQSAEPQLAKQGSAEVTAVNADLGSGGFVREKAKQRRWTSGWMLPPPIRSQPAAEPSNTTVVIGDEGGETIACSADRRMELVAL